MQSEYHITFLYHLQLSIRPFSSSSLEINNTNLSTIRKHSIGHSMSSRFSHRFVLFCLHLPWLGYYLFQVTGGGSSIVTILGSLFSVGDGGGGTGGGTGDGAGV